MNGNRFLYKQLIFLGFTIVFFAFLLVIPQSCGNLFKKDTEEEMREHGGIRMKIKIDESKFILSISDNPLDSLLLNALSEASRVNDSCPENDYFECFVRAFEEKRKSDELNLASLFIQSDKRSEIKICSTNSEVIDYIKSSYNRAVDNAVGVIKSRVKTFGISAPDIRRDDKELGVINIVLPEVDDVDRIVKLILAKGEFGFWETNTYGEIGEFLLEAYNRPEVYQNYDSLLVPLSNLLLLKTDKYLVYDKGSVIGYAKDVDREAILELLTNDTMKQLLPRGLVFMWGMNELIDEPGYYELYALKSYRGHEGPVIDDEVIIESKIVHNSSGGGIEISITMNDVGAKDWERITQENIQKQIAIVIDGNVLSTPIIVGAIKGGKTSITGVFEESEASDISNVLNSGRMLPAELLSIEVVEASE